MILFHEFRVSFPNLSMSLPTFKKPESKIGVCISEGVNKVLNFATDLKMDSVLMLRNLASAMTVSS